MRVHCVKHVEYEGLGAIEPWLISRRHEISMTETYRDPRFPHTDDFDWLIVMGGPMGVNETRVHPWLAGERELIAEAVSSNKVVLGICLGAQLIASSLGARVYANREPEIGWFGVDLADGEGREALSGISPSLEAFHWHSDTFDLPPGARLLARSEGCENQAFSRGPRVLGLQFHLEMTPATINALIENNGSRPLSGPYVQDEEKMRRSKGRCASANAAMTTVLNNLAGSVC